MVATVAFVAVAIHFIRMTVRALTLAVQKAFFASREELAQAFEFTKLEEREGKEFVEGEWRKVVKTFQVADEDAVKVWHRLKAFWAQFLVN